MATEICNPPPSLERVVKFHPVMLKKKKERKEEKKQNRTAFSESARQE